MFVLLLWTACDGGKDDSDSAPAPSCTISLKETVPAADATDVALLTEITYVLSANDPTATISTDIAGSQTSEIRYQDGGLDVIFSPDALLAPGTTYTTSLSWCGGEESFSFTTLTPGTPPDASALPGQTYGIDLKSGTVVEPADAGDVLTEQLVIPPILLEVQSADATSLVFYGGLATDTTMATQNYCAATFSIPAADYTYGPYFALKMDSLVLPIGNGTSATVTDVWITGQVAADAASLTDVYLRGTIDMREGASATGYTPDEICQLLPTLQTACQPCADGENYCLTLGFADITAPATGLDVVEIAADNCDGCESGPPTSCQ